MSSLNMFKQLTTKVPVFATSCRHISNNTRNRLGVAKSKLLLEVPSKIPVYPAVSQIETEWEGVKTKYATFEHPMTQSTNQTENKVFAIVEIQGKQYKVLKGDYVMVNHIRGVDVGDQLSFSNIYLLAGRNFSILGQPLVPNVNVIATVREHTTTNSINVFKMKRRTGYRKLMRYRDQVTILKIDDVEVSMDLPSTKTLKELPMNKMQEPVQL